MWRSLQFATFRMFITVQMQCQKYSSLRWTTIIFFSLLDLSTSTAEKQKFCMLIDISQRQEKDTNFSTQPWGNKSIFITGESIKKGGVSHNVFIYLPFHFAKNRFICSNADNSVLFRYDTCENCGSKKTFSFK